ncbi:MAG: FAD-binding oxidoreductase [Anaerolineae bacterium]|nr:FAD-binding oxidoreductase [Anaerolineae bacterium]
MATFISTPSHENLPRTADVVVIGGGPAGAAALWAIDRAAPTTRTVLLEASESLGAGSSVASLECFRSCWPTLCLARQLERSIEVFLHADEYLGEGAGKDIAVRQNGYFFCAFTEAQAAGLKADVARLHEIGLTHVEYLEAEAIRQRFPWVGERVIAGKFDPMAGWLDSNALIYRFARSAKNAQIVLGVGEIQICVEHGKVIGVTTPFGDIATPRVLIAAGAGAVALARGVGITLPVVIRPRQSFTTAWRDERIPPTSPMIISSAPFAHLRPEAHEGAIFGFEYTWHNKYAGAAYGTNAQHDGLLEPVFPVANLKDPRFPSITLALLARQFGHRDGEGFANPRYLRGIRHNIGYYVCRGDEAAYRVGNEGTHIPYESERAIIDAASEIDGLFLSIAHAGHGIMSSPTAGEIAASRVLGLPFTDPTFADFGIGVHWVEHDERVL